jgi:hypothetical protein
LKQLAAFDADGHGGLLLLLLLVVDGDVLPGWAMRHVFGLQAVP